LTIFNIVNIAQCLKKQLSGTKKIKTSYNNEYPVKENTRPNL